MMIRSRLSRILKRYRASRLPKSGWHTMNVDGLELRLCMDHYLDRSIAEDGVFEKETIAQTRAIVKGGMTVLDVGANFGYFTLQLARLVGSTGRVIAFEPTSYYGNRLRKHIEANGMQAMISICDYGLSDSGGTVEISIGDSSATLHETDPSCRKDSEQIKLRRLDDVAEELKLERLDFVKVDVDGHEPYFLRGAVKTLTRFMPIMVLEFSQLNLEAAGLTVLDQAKLLEDMGYVLVSEKTLRPFVSRKEFLIECGNCAFSANTWAYPKTAPYENSKRITAPSS